MKIISRYALSQCKVIENDDFMNMDLKKCKETKDSDNFMEK